jgi:hypothetical protein
MPTPNVQHRIEGSHSGHDLLRGDPRFEKIVASLALKDLPKEMVSK